MANTKRGSTNMSLFITYREEKGKDLSLNKGEHLKARNAQWGEVTLLLKEARIMWPTRLYYWKEKGLGDKKSVEGLFNHTEKENNTKIIWTPYVVNRHCQRVNAELSNSRIVSKNLHILGTRFGPLNVGNRRRWLPDGRQIGSFIGRWPCNLVRESWEISKEAKREKNPPENGCQVLDQFSFVHVWFASGWECWDPTTVLHQQKVVLIKHFCSKLDQSIGQWTSLPTQCIPAFAFH